MLEPTTAKFEEALLHHAAVVDEGYFIPHVVRAGLKIGTALMGPESSLPESAIVNLETDATFDILASRAVLAEAALQAFVKHHSAYEPEGFFDTFTETIQKIETSVMHTAPIVLKHLIPIVTDIIGNGEVALSAHQPSAEIITRPGLEKNNLWVMFCVK